MVGRPKDNPRTLMMISCQAAVSMVESLELLVQELGFSHSQGAVIKVLAKEVIMGKTLP